MMKADAIASTVDQSNRWPANQKWSKKVSLTQILQWCGCSRKEAWLVVAFFNSLSLSLSLSLSFLLAYTKLQEFIPRFVLITSSVLFSFFFDLLFGFSILLHPLPSFLLFSLFLSLSLLLHFSTRWVTWWRNGVSFNWCLFSIEKMLLTLQTYLWVTEEEAEVEVSLLSWIERERERERNLGNLNHLASAKVAQNRDWMK